MDNVQFLTAMLDRLEGPGGDAIEEAQCTRTVSVPMLDSFSSYVGLFRFVQVIF